MFNLHYINSIFTNLIRLLITNCQILDILKKNSVYMDINLCYTYTLLSISESDKVVSNTIWITYGEK